MLTTRSLALAVGALASLVVMPSPVSAGKCFNDKRELRAAIEQYDPLDSSNTVATTYGFPINTWCVEKVTDFSWLFADLTDFNEDIGNWPTSQVTDMSYAFFNTASFDQDLRDWDTSNVVDMSSMFTGAVQQRNPAINNWNVSKVQSFQSMFAQNVRLWQVFNQWQTTSAVDMSFMFDRTVSFNQPVANFDVSKVVDFTSMFEFSRYNQPLNTWVTSSAKYMREMFKDDPFFDQSINNWQTGGVIDTSYMFSGATALTNKWMGDLNLSNVKYMNSMFEGATNFKAYIGDWKPTKVQDVSFMFRNAANFSGQGTQFWSVPELTYAEEAFKDAPKLNAGYCGWGAPLQANLQSSRDKSGMFENTACPYTDDPFIHPTKGVHPMCKWCASITFDCFADEIELRAAVDIYFDNMAEFDSTPTAQKYGPDITQWCVSQVKDFSWLFAFRDFNLPLNSWDFTNAEDMSFMFYMNPTFEQDVGSWKVNNVKDFSSMFAGTKSFTGKGTQFWKVFAAESMQGMFAKAETFWTWIADWRPWAVTDLSFFAYDAPKYKTVVRYWPTGLVTDFSYAFAGLPKWYSHVNDLDVTNCHDFSSMFRDTTIWNERVNKWNTPNATDMSNMFNGAKQFNQFANFDTSSVKHINGMFQGAPMYNQWTAHFDTSEVLDATNVFESATAFNQFLTTWDLSKVKFADGAFKGATAFSKDLCSWSQTLPLDASVKDMFVSTSCPVTSDPDVSTGGPFCNVCA